MAVPGKRLGLLLSTRPETPSFRHAARLAEAALNGGLTVYLYCIDDAVWGLSDPQLQRLKEQGAILYACAYGAQKRNIPRSDQAVFAGLSIVSDLISATDRFMAFG